MPARLNEAFPSPEPAYFRASIPDSSRVRRVIFAPLDVEELLRQDRLRPPGSPLRISTRRPVFPTEGWPGSARLGDWVRLPDGRRVWRIEFEVTGAQGVRVHFAGVELPGGAALVLYPTGEPGAVVEGHEAATLRGRREFWSGTIFSSRVTLECQILDGVDPAGVGFEVDAVLHRYRKSVPDGRAAGLMAGDCHNDVACHPDWELVSRAVAGLGVPGVEGEIFCSGCLVNDADPAAGTDYLVTGNHCVRSQQEADDTEFYWLYRAQSCGGSVPAPATVPRTGGGADYLGGSDDRVGSDTILVRLRSGVPGGVAFAGWTTASPGPDEPLTCIHHPEGSFQRISFGRESWRSDLFREVLWSDGVTEPGSSGGPLFNSQKQVIGHLFGGRSSCDEPDGADYFGRLDTMLPWLMPWLAGKPAPPGNDALASGWELLGGSGSVEGWTVGATREVGEPRHAGNAGGHSVWHRWVAPSNGVVTFATSGSRFDTLLGVYTGTGVDRLVLVAQSEDGPAAPLSSVAFAASAGTPYWVAVDGFDGLAGNYVLMWRPGDYPGGLDNDAFSRQWEMLGGRGVLATHNFGATREVGEPDHAANPGGASVWFAWTARATGPVVFDTEGSVPDTLLAVYRGSVLNQLTSVAANDDLDAGTENYASRVQFTAQAGTTYRVALDTLSTDLFAPQLGSLRLTWYPPRPGSGVAPTNDSMASAQRLVGASGSVTNTNERATRENGEPALVGGGGRTVWHRWQAPAAGMVTFQTVGSDFDTVLGVFRGTSPAGLVALAQNNDIDGRQVASRVSALVQSGEELWVGVDGVAAASGDVRVGTLRLEWALAAGVAGNDAFGQARLLEGVAGEVDGENRTATAEAAEPAHGGAPARASIWYRWRAPATGPVQLDTTGSTFATLLAVYQGSGLESLQPVTQGRAADPLQGDRAARARFEAREGVEYQWAIDGARGLEDSGPARGSVRLSWRQEVAAPVQLSNPSLGIPGFSAPLSGPPGGLGRLEYSGDLKTWTAVFTNRLDGAGKAVMVDPQAGGRASGFYRARVE